MHHIIAHNMNLYSLHERDLLKTKEVKIVFTRACRGLTDSLVMENKTRF